MHEEQEGSQVDDQWDGQQATHRELYELRRQINEVKYHRLLAITGLVLLPFLIAVTSKKKPKTTKAIAP